MTTNTAAKGVVVQMGGRAIRFLPLNWQQLEDLQDDLERASSMGDRVGKAAFFDKEERDSIIKIVTASIVRGNPDVDAQWVKENLDLSNVARVVAAVFNASGFTDAPQEAQPMPGALEANAQQGEAVAAGSGS